MSHISIDKLYKTYPGATPVKALEDINLQVAPGELVALLGPSGCGKSTLLNLIAGFEQPSQGQLLVDALRLGKRDLRPQGARHGTQRVRRPRP